MSSDALFAAGFALVALLVARFLDRPTSGRAAALGVSVALLVLVRPVAQVLLLFVLHRSLVATGWRGRMQGMAAFAVAAALPLVGWSLHNQARFDDFTIARGGGVTFPLFRAFVADRIVEPENGEASRELARVVGRDLLPYEPYRSYGIDVDEFFGSGSSRMHDDLNVLADRTWGWDDDYRHLARVGREAVLAHPETYARGVGKDVWRLLLWPLYPPAPLGDAPDAPAAAAPAPSGGGSALPTPSEGQPIPSAREAPFISTPDGRNREVWTSATEHHVVFGDPDDVARAAALDRRVEELLAAFPDRDARSSLVSLLDHASRWYPRPFMWLSPGPRGGRVAAPCPVRACAHARRRRARPAPRHHARRVRGGGVRGPGRAGIRPASDCRRARALPSSPCRISESFPELSSIVFAAQTSIPTPGLRCSRTRAG